MNESFIEKNLKVAKAQIKNPDRLKENLPAIEININKHIMK